MGTSCCWSSNDYVYEIGGQGGVAPFDIFFATHSAIAGPFRRAPEASSFPVLPLSPLVVAEYSLTMVYCIKLSK